MPLTGGSGRSGLLPCRDSICSLLRGGRPPASSSGLQLRTGHVRPPPRPASPRCSRQSAAGAFGAGSANPSLPSLRCARPCPGAHPGLELQYVRCWELPAGSETVARRALASCSSSRASSVLSPLLGSPQSKTAIQIEDVALKRDSG